MRVHMITMSCLILCSAVGAAYAGIQYHVGPGFDAGSLLQWCAIALLSIGSVGLVIGISHEEG